MTKVDLFHNLRVKFNELSLREHLIVEETIMELEQEETSKLIDIINGQDVKIADLEKQIEKMKQCGNCGNWSIGNCENCRRKKGQMFADNLTSDYWKLKE